jgi:hypothetical protein
MSEPAKCAQDEPDRDRPVSNPIEVPRVDIEEQRLRHLPPETPIKVARWLQRVYDQSSGTWFGVICQGLVVGTSNAFVPPHVLQFVEQELPVPAGGVPGVEGSALKTYKDLYAASGVENKEL